MLLLTTFGAFSFFISWTILGHEACANGYAEEDYGNYAQKEHKAQKLFSLVIFSHLQLQTILRIRDQARFRNGQREIGDNRHPDGKRHPYV